MSSKQQKLQDRLTSDVDRKKKHQEDERSILAQTVFLGTIGILIVLPAVAGAYFGHWLDTRIEGFSFRWTISFIILGIFVGVLNVIFFIKEH